MNKFELDNHKKINTGFKVPDNYFESFEEKLFQNSVLSETNVKVIPLWQKTKVWVIGLAAVIVITLGITFFQINSNTVIGMTSENYIAMEDHLTTDDFADVLTNEDIASLEDEIYKYDENSINYINENLN